MRGGRAAATRGAQRQLLRGRRAALGCVALLSFLSGASQALLLVVVVRAGASLDDGGGRFELAVGPFSGHLDASGALAVLLGLAAVVLAAESAAALIASRAGAATLAELRAGLFRSFAHAGFSLQADERSGRLQELVLTNASNGAQAVLVGSSGLAAMVSLAALLAGAVVVNPAGALLIGAALAGLGLLLRPLHLRSRRLSEEVADANLGLISAVNEGVELSLETATFGTEPELIRRFQAADRAVVDGWRRKYRNLRMVPPIFRNGALVVVLAALGAAYAADVADVAALSAIVLILIRAITYAQAVQASAQQLAELLPWVERLLAAEARYMAAAPAGGNRPVEAIEQIQLQAVAYTYDGARRALEGASLDVRRGEAIGLIGPSGAGKSTLVHLLLGLRAPDAGAVLVDGHDLRTLQRRAFTRLVAFVPQEGHTFAGTVTENIAFFRDLDAETVRQAAIAARLHDEVMAWPDGYDTLLAERGGRLSGGQRQRLVLARALASHPAVLVLDEPTSSLDARSEALVHDTLEELKSRCALVIVAHRLSTLRLCDRLAVVEGGRVTAVGSPAEVLETSAYYRDAVRLSRL